MAGLAHCLAAVLSVSAPAAGKAAPDSSARPKIDRPNSVMAGAVVEIPNAGVVVAYERVVHRAFGLRFDLEHLPSPAGFTHLPGMSASVGLMAWPLKAGHGPFLLAGGGVGTNFWARRPAISRIVGLFDVAAGYRFVFPIGLSLGASAGLRYGFEAKQEDRLCTHRDICRNARTGPFARLVMEVGWRFGRRSSPG